MNRTMHKTRSVDVTFIAPPSKSYTHRALIIGALGPGKTILKNPLFSVDTMLTARALESLGVPLQVKEDTIEITGCKGRFAPGSEVWLDLENSGTSIRLLASVALLCDSPVTLTGNARMQERPIGPLGDALIAAGGRVTYTGRKGFPPIRVEGHLFGGEVPVDGSVSSQFISSLMLVAPYAEQEMTIFLHRDPASRSYLDVTAQIMEDFGISVWRKGYRTFRIGNRHKYNSRVYPIEGDFSSASYFLALAALCGGTVLVAGLNPKSRQGDRLFADALAAMGCSVSFGPEGVTVSRHRSLHGITIDMSMSPDTVQTLAMVAALADSPTTITGIGHLRYKESDRLEVTVRQLRSLGGDVELSDDSLTIRPVPLHGGTIDPAGDHRTAMSFAVLGLAIGDVTIEHSQCVNKSFPGFWEALALAGL